MSKGKTTHHGTRNDWLTATRAIEGYLSETARLVFPVDCLGCLRPDTPLCRVCSLSLRLAMRHPFSAGASAPALADNPGLSVYAAGIYRDQLSRAILRYKEHPAPLVHRVLSGGLKAAFDYAMGKEGLSGEEVLVPVPPAQGSFYRRGFEPVRSLLVSLPGQRGRLLRRRFRLTASAQKRSGLIRREAQAFRALRLNQGAARSYPIGADCILVDDVLTTGASLTEATRVLESSGFRVRAAIVIAAVGRNEGLRAPQNIQGTG